MLYLFLLMTTAIFIQIDIRPSNTEEEETSRNAEQNRHANPVVVSHD